jgi:hypothetical protein
MGQGDNQMKFLKIATTISFMMVFAFVAVNYDHLYSNIVTTKVIEKPRTEAPAPSPKFNKIPQPGPGGMYDIYSSDRPKNKGVSPPDVYKSDPPAPPLRPAPEVITITSKSEYNDYVKGAAGTAVGWSVKEICAWLLNLVKNLLKRRFV